MNPSAQETGGPPAGAAPERVDVAVVGAGVAGVAAAFALCRRGREVLLLDGGPGATGLSSGAWDCEPWTVHRSSAPPLSEELLEFLRALGRFDDAALRAAGAGELRAVVSGAPLLRTTRLAAPELLAFPAEGPVGQGAATPLYVAAVPRPDWDAPGIAAALGGALLPLEGVWSTAELALPLAAFCRCFQLGHARRLAHALAALPPRPGGGRLLLGPWLGVEPAALEPLRQASQRRLCALGFELGECTSPPEGPAGPRERAALDALLERLGVERRSARVTGLEAAGAGGLVRLHFDSAVLEARAVVLATGGLVGGGLSLATTPGGALAPALLPGLGAGSGSSFGIDPAADHGAWLAQRPPRGAPYEQLPGIVLAGDVRSASGGTMLGAALDGLAAGALLVAAH